MARKSKIGYFCAGVGAGTALAVLFAPKPGAEMRGHLRAAAEDGVDRLKDQAYDALDALEYKLEHRDDLIRTGKQHLKLAVESGRAAYQKTVNAPVGSLPEMTTAGALGVLAFEAAAVATGYQLVRGMGRRLRTVAPKVEGLRDTSRAAVTNTALDIAAVTSTGLQVLRQIEKFLRARSPGLDCPGLD